MSGIREVTSTVWTVDGREFKTEEQAKDYLERQAEARRQELRREPLVFEVHEDHLKLMRRIYFDWWNCEFGAPAVNPKRPYGNSDVYSDIADILGLELFKDSCGEYHLSAEQEAYCLGRHLDMQTFLELMCRFGEVPSGKYKRRETYCAWEKVPETNDQPTGITELPTSVQTENVSQNGSKGEGE